MSIRIYIGYIDYAHLKLNYAFIKDVNIICSFLKSRYIELNTDTLLTLHTWVSGQQPWPSQQVNGTLRPDNEPPTPAATHPPRPASKAQTNHPGPQNPPQNRNTLPGVHPKPRRMNPPETS